MSGRRRASAAFVGAGAREAGPAHGLASLFKFRMLSSPPQPQITPQHHETLGSAPKPVLSGYY